MVERCGKLPITLLLQGMCQLIMHWWNTPRLRMTQTAQHNSHFLTVCTVANCRQHRAAENRLRHRVLHKTPSFPWADPSLFCINANYIILSGMQIRLDEAMADHLYRSVSYRFQIRKNGTFQHKDFDISYLSNQLLICDAIDYHRLWRGAHARRNATAAAPYRHFQCLQMWLLLQRSQGCWSLAVGKTQFA